MTQSNPRPTTQERIFRSPLVNNFNYPSHVLKHVGASSQVFKNQNLKKQINIDDQMIAIPIDEQPVQEASSSIVPPETQQNEKETTSKYTEDFSD